MLLRTHLRPCQLNPVRTGVPQGKIMSDAHRSESEAAQSCLTLCDHMDCSLPGSSIHEIFQARVLEWVAISYPEDLLDPGIEPMSLYISWPAGGFFITSATWEAHLCFCSVAQSCLTLCDPMECSTPGFPVLHHLLELAQTQVH